MSDTPAAPAAAPRLRRGVLAALAVCSLVFGWILLRTAWTCDDAFVTFRSVEQILDGNGPRWNPHERVQAFTHPLWLLAVTCVRVVLGDPVRAALVLSFACALATFWLLAKAVADDALRIVVVLATLLGSRAFVDFSSSGLEDPLSHLLLVAFAWILFQAPDGSPVTALRQASWPAGLALLCRHDSVWLVAPPLLWLAWRLQERGLRWLVRTSLPAWLPLTTWTAFSVVYFGFPFPNTAYAKLNTGIAAHELWRRGVDYLANVAVWDPWTPAVVVAGAWLWARRGSLGRVVSFGLLLHVLYVVRIGGDFMAGRFFTEPFAVAVVALLLGLERRAATATLAAVTAFVVLWPLSPLYVSPGYVSYHPDDANGIADERAFYTGRSGFSDFERRWPVALWQSQPDPQEHFEVGFSAYSVGTDRSVIDRFALADPLLARLPADDDWRRIGHFRRTLPAGYVESLRSGDNRIGNPFVHRLYDDLRLVTQGPLLSGARWAAIWRLNVTYRRPGCLEPPCRKLMTQALPPQLFRPLLPVAETTVGGVESVTVEDASVVIEGTVPFELLDGDQLVRVIAPIHPQEHTLTLAPGQDPAGDLRGFRAVLQFADAATAAGVAPATCIAVAAAGGPWRLLAPPPSNAICARLGEEP